MADDLKKMGEFGPKELERENWKHILPFFSNCGIRLGQVLWPKYWFFDMKICG